MVATETQGESVFSMPSGIVSEAEVPPVTIAGVDRSRYKGAWYQAMGKIKARPCRIEDVHGVGQRYPKRKKPLVYSGCMLSYKSDKDWLITKTKARLVAKGSCRERV